MSSQDATIAGSSRGTFRPQPNLGNRFSQPESKKARKRRRRAERQAMEEARLRNIDWLNNQSPFAQGVPLFAPTAAFPPPLAWPHYQFSNVLPMNVALGHPYDDSYDLDDGSFYDNDAPRSPSPPSFPTSFPMSGSDWVSSMAMAADSTAAEQADDVSNWSSVSTPVPMPPQYSPPPMPPPLPPPMVLPPIHVPNPNLPLKPKQAEYHSLPAKPAPAPVIQPIGMDPDPDPNSKHGLFDLANASKDGSKKRVASYIPNPSRTLVMEQLPKTHRNVDFARNWARARCGVNPIHVFAHAPSGKALVEFPNAELARKAWESPKLGRALTSLKPPQLKGKSREDQIKVWWYRVNGVGAGSGVGEIEEGEIEEDVATEKGPELPVVETKKQKKARLAREREENKSRKESKLRAAQQLSAALNQDAVESPLNNVDELQTAVSLTREQIKPSASLPGPSGAVQSPLAMEPRPVLKPLQILQRVHLYSHPTHPSHHELPLSTRNHHIHQQLTSSKTTYGSSIPSGHRGGHDDNESIASSDGRPSMSPISASKTVVALTVGQGDDLDDYEEMDMDIDNVPSPLVQACPRPLSPRIEPATLQPSSSTPQTMHHSLPPRPVPHAATKQSRQLQTQNRAASPTITPQVVTSVYQNEAQPSLCHAGGPANQGSRSPESSTSTFIDPLSPVPRPDAGPANTTSETNPAKLILMARQMELEASIAKSKHELAAAEAVMKKVHTGVAPSQPSMLIKPSMDLGGKQAMEDRLRKLVLESKNKRAAASNASLLTHKPAKPAKPTISMPSSQGQNFEASNSEAPLPPVSEPAAARSSTVSISTSSHSFSLEDLAVSFISQTIETMKAQPQYISVPIAGAAASAYSIRAGSTTTSASATPPPPTPNTPVSGLPPTTTSAAVKATLHQATRAGGVKAEWAAKQQRLEDHIAETKGLMDRLTKARSKEEKDLILKIMREKSRCVIQSCLIF